MLDLDAPEITPDEAVLIALRLRLEVQTERDQIDDLRRKVDLAKNGLLSDLDLNGSVLVPFADPTLEHRFRSQSRTRFHSEWA